MDQNIDFIQEPYMEYCYECKMYVIALNNHCINNDEHITKQLDKKEFDNLGLATIIPDKKRFLAYIDENILHLESKAFKVSNGDY